MEEWEWVFTYLQVFWRLKTSGELKKTIPIFLSCGEIDLLSYNTWSE